MVAKKKCYTQNMMHKIHFQLFSHSCMDHNILLMMFCKGGRNVRLPQVGAALGWRGTGEVQPNSESISDREKYGSLSIALHQSFNAHMDSDI